MLSKPWKRLIAAIGSVMLALLLVFGNAVPAHAASYGTAGETGNANSIVNIVLVVTVVVLIGINICLVLAMCKQSKERTREREKADERYRRLSRLRRETAYTLDRAEKDIGILEDWQARAISVNPGIQVQINNQIDKEAADKFAEDYLQIEQAELEGLEPCKAYDVLDKIFSAYRALAPEVKKFVEYDMDALKKTFEGVTSNYTKGAVQYLAEVNNTTKGRFEELETLKEALRYFDALPYAIQKAVPERIVSKLKMKEANAEMYLPLDTSVNEEEE